MYKPYGIGRLQKVRNGIVKVEFNPSVFMDPPYRLTSGDRYNKRMHWHGAGQVLFTVRRMKRWTNSANLTLKQNARPSLTGCFRTVFPGWTSAMRSLWTRSA